MDGTTDESSSQYAFTNDEVTRLVLYRSAVRAGFFAEDPALDVDSGSGPEKRKLVARFAVYRLAVAAGLYTDAI